MKPIKPKPMPKALETWLCGVVTGAANPTDMTKFDARSILAALAYERKRADDAEAEARKTRASIGPRVFFGSNQPATFKMREEVVTPECQRAFTEAVVPKPRKPHSECAYMGCETHDPGTNAKSRKKKG